MKQNILSLKTVRVVHIADTLMRDIIYETNNKKFGNSLSKECGNAVSISKQVL